MKQIMVWLYFEWTRFDGEWFVEAQGGRIQVSKSCVGDLSVVGELARSAACGEFLPLGASE